MFSELSSWTNLWGGFAFRCDLRVTFGIPETT
jgi:hypothetical protein